MPYIQPLALPRLLFAHAYSANTYTNMLLPRRNSVEITYICSGTLTFTQAGQSFTASAGDVHCNIFDVPRRVQTQTPHSHHTVCFTFPFSVAQQPGLGFHCLPVVTHTGEDSHRVLALIDAIIRENDQNTGRELTCTGLFLQLLDLVAACADRTRTDLRHSDLQYIEKAKKLIFSNLTQKISQRQIAEQLGITPGYLCAVFKKVEGIPLMQFVNRAKLEKVRALMEKEHLKLYQAAERYGYTDPNYVSRLYQKYFHTHITGGALPQGRHTIEKENE